MITRTELEASNPGLVADLRAEGVAIERARCVAYSGRKLSL